MTLRCYCPWLYWWWWHWWQISVWYGIRAMTRYVFNVLFRSNILLDYICFNYCCYCYARSRMYTHRGSIFKSYRRFHGINWKMRSSWRSCTFTLFNINCEFLLVFLRLYTLATQNESAMTNLVVSMTWRHTKRNQFKINWTIKTSSMQILKELKNEQFTGISL